MAQALTALGRLDAARKVADEALAMWPDNTTMQSRHHAVLRDIGNKQKP